MSKLIGFLLGCLVGYGIMSVAHAMGANIPVPAVLVVVGSGVMVGIFC